MYIYIYICAHIHIYIYIYIYLPPRFARRGVTGLWPRRLRLFCRLAIAPRLAWLALACLGVPPRSTTRVRPVEILTRG